MVAQHGDWQWADIKDDWWKPLQHFVGVLCNIPGLAKNINYISTIYIMIVSWYFQAKILWYFFIFSKYQPLLLLLFTYFLIRAYLTQKRKVKEVNLYSAFIVVPHTQGAQVRITQCYLQITPYLPLPRKHSPDGASPDWGCGHLIAAYYSFIYPERMKGWVGLVGWPTVDSLPT